MYIQMDTYRRLMQLLAIVNALIKAEIRSFRQDLYLLSPTLQLRLLLY